MMTMAVFQVVSSTLIGKLFNKYKVERYHIIMTGIVFMVVQNILLGMLEYTNSSKKFLIMSFIAQAIGGMGSGMTSTANLAIISSFSSVERDRFFGYVEACNGIGLLFGPICGAFLYSIGGFQLPFFFFASLQIIAFPILTSIFLKVNREQNEVIRN